MRYFIDGKEVTKEEAEKQEKRNDEIIRAEYTSNLEWLQKMSEIKFIAKI